MWVIGLSLIFKFGFCVLFLKLYFLRVGYLRLFGRYRCLTCSICFVLILKLCICWLGLYFGRNFCWYFIFILLVGIFMFFMVLFCFVLVMLINFCVFFFLSACDTWNDAFVEFVICVVWMMLFCSNFFKILGLFDFK